MASADTTVASAPERVVIRPPRGWSELRLRELWEFRELLYFLTKRELQVRYAQSLFGISWAVLQPVVLAAVFSLFFGVLSDFDAPADLPYPVFALAGLVPWFFFAQSVNMAASSLVADANLLTKVYFPRLALPLARVLALTVDLCIAVAVLLAVMVLYGVGFSWAVLLAPAFLLLALIAALGVGCLLAALNVRYRDVATATPLIVQIGLFVSPIIYPSELVPGAWKYVYALNPMVTVIEGLRWSLLGNPDPNLAVYAVSVASALALFIAGFVYFRRTEQFFADVI
jgi:lipopolysaccharide transport system permease protein